MRFARLWIDFVPPSQANKPPSSNVFEVVEVDGEQDDGEDENKDEVFGEPEAEYVDQETCCCGSVWEYQKGACSSAAAYIS